MSVDLFVFCLFIEEKRTYVSAWAKKKKPFERQLKMNLGFNMQGNHFNHLYVHLLSPPSRPFDYSFLPRSKNFLIESAKYPLILFLSFKNICSDNKTYGKFFFKSSYRKKCLFYHLPQIFVSFFFIFIFISIFIFFLGSGPKGPISYRTQG